MKHTVKAALVRQLGGIKQVFLFQFGEEELRGSHPLNEMHELMAARALPQRGLCEERCFGGRSLVEQSAAEWQHASSSAVGEEAEVADTWKALWQHVPYGACWDADRLDLTRIGLRPEPRFMSTAVGRSLSVLIGNKSLT
jgi:hypothetical protein